MKHLRFLTLAVGLLGCIVAPVSANKAPKAASATAKIKISGMDCEGCAGGLVTKLKGLKGVANARVDFKKSLGTIQYDPKVRKPADFVAAAKEQGLLAKVVQ
jgi:copper chaperone CopZ